ncbi:MAG: EVE domain-containing protein [Zetaproteobacteria bacterium]|nr:EVE domain-containing protein [Zetaproteobacteria bacterium]
MTAYRYWLLKSEPLTYSIDDFASLGVDHWDGVRNYQARNFLKEMQVGDYAFFYHSNCKVPGVVGLARVVRAAYPDHTSFDKSSKYYDPKSSPDNPRWFMVDLEFVEKFGREASLTELKHQPALEDLRLVQRGNRLSVMPVTAKEAQCILRLCEASLV